MDFISIIFSAELYKDVMSLIVDGDAWTTLSCNMKNEKSNRVHKHMACLPDDVCNLKYTKTKIDAYHMLQIHSLHYSNS